MGRAERNKTLREWEELKRLIEELDPLVTPVLLRTRDDADIRRNIAIKPNDPEHGASALAHSDPTGETATSWRVRENTEKTVDAMAVHIIAALDKAKNVLEVAPRSVMERAERSIPNCLACGDPIAGKIIGGYDRACYDRWIYLGRPDRKHFEYEQQHQKDSNPSDLHSNQNETHD